MSSPLNDGAAGAILKKSGAEESSSAKKNRRRRQNNRKKKNMVEDSQGDCKGKADTACDRQATMEGDGAPPNHIQNTSQKIPSSTTSDDGDLLAFPVEKMKLSEEGGAEPSKLSNARRDNKPVRSPEGDTDISASGGVSNKNSRKSSGDACKGNRRPTSTPSKARSSTSTPTKQIKAQPTQFRSTEPTADSFRYWSKDDIEQGLSLGTVIRGPLRINPKNFRQCFIPYTNNYIDVYIPWRNRALNGDIVAVHLLDKMLSRVLTDDILSDLRDSGCAAPSASNGNNQHLDYVRLHKYLADNPEQVKLLQGKYSLESGIPDKFLQPVGVVVYVLEQKHSRLAAGQLQPRTDGNNNYAFFIPNDCRLPRIDIPINYCPPDLLQRPQDYEDKLYVAKITAWKEGNARANGTLVKALGSMKEVEPMTQAILMEYGVDSEEFPDEVNSCLPGNLPWAIPNEELSGRRDFTKECVFTIDPSTARDLDDALSCRQVGSDTYEVGVHIADVSYFIEQGNALDQMAASRATSVYMVQKVIPMLPRLLCEQLCSLNPDEKRLAFSVLWHIDIEGNITKEWFGRSVIKSCAKLSYQHAQGFIEEPDRDWRADELPPISDGFTVSDIKSRVLVLDKIAKILRRKRFEQGALRLDQTKLSYTLDNDTGYPTGYYIYELKDSNRMIEEYMLLANMAVARKIYNAFPEIAVLRNHAEPQGKQLSDLELSCQQMGLSIDTTSSLTMQQSLAQYLGGDSDEEQGKFQILMQMCTKPMQRAQYFCTGSLDDEALYRHYALSVPLYTHFTSPIRRYADVMVHRLLAASLDYCAQPVGDSKYFNSQAKHCNDKKDNAKNAGNLSLEMFFVAFLKECGPIVERVMIMGVLDRAVDVVCIKLGYKKRIYTEKLNLKTLPQFNNDGPPTLTLTWPSLDPLSNSTVTQTLRLFDIVKCQLVAGKDIVHFQAELLHPDHAGE